MKNALLILASGLLGFFVVYLLGAFSNFSFVLADWSETSRFIVASIGAIAAIVSGAVVSELLDVFNRGK